MLVSRRLSPGTRLWHRGSGCTRQTPLAPPTNAALDSEIASAPLRGSDPNFVYFRASWFRCKRDEVNGGDRRI